MSVKVGVRVRPFNQRQKDLNCKLCVDMMGPTTRLLDADDHDKFRDFTFDYSFWSHDQFHTDDKGYFVPDSNKYADQQHVFEQVGLEILANAWQGYHCCLFAYGQTGAGKSYSMVGYGSNKVQKILAQGIVPISCQQIFNRTNNNHDKNKEYQVNVSMLQIYNERVQDLLIPISKRGKQGLKIRQHKTLGIYVEGLSKHFVDTYQSIQCKMEEGGKNRSIAATQMNASSSRAHTIISIQFKQIQVLEGKKREKLSVIYLVDLAGSQKVGKTGATGDRLKEAAGINKSLSVLGLVISTLADKAMGKGKNIIVPYRDSCLTRILQNALGGNSKTLMICAISPANDNYQQTLSTLRYADQAKKIQNKAVVNQSQTDKIIRNLTAQKDQLKQKVAKFEQMFKKLSMGLGIDQTKLQEFNDAKEQLRFNTMMMNDMTMTRKEKLKYQNAQVISDVHKVDKSRPHLSNLNQDPQLSRKINYSIDMEVIKLGRRNAEPQNDIQIGGMGIRNLHARFMKEADGKIYLQPVCEGEDSACYINGETITEKVQLFHYDRLTFGTNNMFIVMIPTTDPRNPQIDLNTLDWQYAQNELYLKKQVLQKQQMQQMQRKIKQQTEQILRKKQQQLQQLQQKLKQNQQQRRNIEQQKQQQKAEIQKKLKQQEAQRLKLEIEKNKKKIQDRQSQHKERVKQKYYFQKKLLKTLPKCIQLNLIAKEFKRNISMSVKMLMPNQEEDQEEEQDIDLKRRIIKIKVVNRESGYNYWWDVEKLENRYYIIKDMSETYFESGNIPELSQKDDPFWDPPEHALIGRAFLTTKALSYLFDNQTTLSIIGQQDHCGQLTVNMIPTDQLGQRNLCQQMDEEQSQFQPQQLMNKPFYYNVVIQSASIPDNYQNIYVEYAVRVDQKKSQSFKTQEILEKTRNPVFNYKRLHKFENITNALLEYLSKAKIVFKVYAYELVTKQKKQTQSPPKPPQIQQKPHPEQIITPVAVQKLRPVNQQPTKPTTVEPAIKTGKIEWGIGVNVTQSKATTTPTNTTTPNTTKNTAGTVVGKGQGTAVSVQPAKKKKKEKEDCVIF